MAAPTPNALVDSLGPCALGIHSGLPPVLLPQGQASFAVNVTMRDGFPRTRPRWAKIALTYAGPITQASATRAIFQGAAFYNGYGGISSCLVASIGGRIFRYAITGQSAKVQEITPQVPNGTAIDPNNPLLLQAWMAQGQEFLLISDGQSFNIVFDGAGTSRLSSPNQLPPCRQSHYCNGRFVVALPDTRSYIASDLVYTVPSSGQSGGTPAHNYRDSILYINDNQAILGGRAFAVPLSAGPITALFSVAIPDTSLGQGPLQVATTGGIFSVTLPLDATLWTTTQQPSQVITLPNGGITGQFAVTTVNGDAWYRSLDGLRSFVTARRDFNTWVQTALSFELERVLPYDTQPLLGHASAVNFSNRLLCTCSPYDTRGRGIAHRGLVALDFNNISSLTTRSQPAYDGLWTGQPVLQLLTGDIDGVNRCFAFCLDGEGDICLYEIGADNAGWFDYDGTQDVATECWLESAALLGKDADPRSLVFKRLLTGNLFLARLAGVDEGTLPITLSYTSDQYPCWQDWHSFTLCARSCAQPEACAQPLTTQPQYATYLVIPQPDDTCNPITDRPFRTGYTFQVKLAWSGSLELRRLLLWASPQPEPPNVQCGDAPCKLLQCCADDLFTYSIETFNPPSCDITITVQPHVDYSDGVFEWDTDNNAPTWDDETGSPITPLDL